ncbi:uncharacterized protein LOC119069167 [Bradysia coprophila]|uniref:uncharacterized protein LOC119069167 n=1 Tax=Bradysia coprophila TaxID=38358 RepID=UPI00187DC232|nr:uncharacterized protein LOC119069167 [Bradysia coprophila]
MKKGIFAHRKINSNPGIENSADKLKDPVKKPWQQEKISFNQAKISAKDDDLPLVKQPSHEDGSSISYFLQVNEDYDRLMKRMDCVPDELATFIDNELKRAEDKNALMQRELLEKIENLRDSVTKVEKSMTDETQTRINGCLKDTISTMMKQHESQIQSIIKSTLPNPSIHSNESFLKVLDEDHARESHVKIDTNSECFKRQVSNRNVQLEPLTTAVSGDDAQAVTQLYANEQSELKYVLMKDELAKRQIVLDEVLLINEALRIKIREYELDGLKLSLVKLPVSDSSVQTDNWKDLRHNELCNESRSESVDEIRESVSSIKSSPSNFQYDSVSTMKEMISKLKIDDRKRRRKVEKLVLKNFSLKLEVCELKKEIKKYSSVWANDRYFNSLFLDTTKVTVSK